MRQDRHYACRDVRDITGHLERQHYRAIVLAWNGYLNRPSACCRRSFWTGTTVQGHYSPRGLVDLYLTRTCAGSSPIPGSTWTGPSKPSALLGGLQCSERTTAGFIAVPYGLAKPHDPLVVFRGATQEHGRGMSWTVNIDRAEQFRQRHAWHAPTAIFRATVSPACQRRLKNDPVWDCVFPARSR